MLLFTKRFHEGLQSGAITLTFRRWAKPHVKAGGRYRCHPIGVLEVDRIEQVAAEAISERDAHRAGFANRAEMLETMGCTPDDATPVWRVEFHYGGDGDRVAIALEDELSSEDVDEITKKLARMDSKAPWTRETLDLIEKRPRVVASKLAAQLGRETEPFKSDVRKLKKLGLTQSFEEGYEISPRGRAYRAAIARSRPPKRTPLRRGRQRGIS
jgi:hypothetical protein